MRADPEKAEANVRGWVLYDGECVFCTGWITKVEQVLERRGYAVEALQAPWVKSKLKLKDDEVLSDIRLWTREGRLYNGSAAYLYVLRRVWWTWPLGVLFALPGLNALFDAAYRWFNKRRYCVAGKCELPRRS